MNPKSTVQNSIVLGLALFAMFFGAGNLIFPPAIGIEGGQDWFTGFIAYFVADVGLALFSVIAMLRADGQLDKVIGSVGRVPATVLNVAIIACIGPLLAIPRTAATTYEMAPPPSSAPSSTPWRCRCSRCSSSRWCCWSP